MIRGESDSFKASIRHFVWKEASLLRLEPDSFVASVDIAQGQLVGEAKPVEAVERSSRAQGKEVNE